MSIFTAYILKVFLPLAALRGGDAEAAFIAAFAL